MQSTATRVQRDRPFDAEEFVALLNQTVFEGKLTEALEELSAEQQNKLLLSWCRNSNGKSGRARS